MSPGSWRFRGPALLAESPSLPTGGTEVAVDTGVETDHEEATGIELPEVLPVLPLKNTVLFPYLLNPLLVNSERSKRLIDALPAR